MSGDCIPIYLVYELPPVSPLCDADARRLAHRDLNELGAEGLADEALRLRLALAFGDLGRPVWAESWLRERLARCRALLRQKGGAA